MDKISQATRRKLKALGYLYDRVDRGLMRFTCLDCGAHVWVPDGGVLDACTACMLAAESQRTAFGESTWKPAAKA